VRQRSCRDTSLPLFLSSVAGLRCVDVRNGILPTCRSFATTIDLVQLFPRSLSRCCTAVSFLQFIFISFNWMTTWSVFGGKLAVEAILSCHFKPVICLSLIARKSCVGHANQLDGQTSEAVPVQTWLQLQSSCSALKFPCLVFCLAILSQLFASDI